MKNPKVLVAQIEITYSNPKKNLEKVRKYCKLAHKNNCDFIVFPEYLYGSDRVHTTIKNNFFVDTIKKYAKEFNLYIIAGSFILKIGKNKHNTSLLICKKGKIIGQHCKIALVKYGELQKLTPGNNTNVFNTEFGKIGIAICRDMLYPAIIKNLSDKGAKIIFIPTFWSYSSTHYEEENTPLSNPMPPHTEFISLKNIPLTRAIENECFIIVANAAGIFSWKEKEKKFIEMLGGHSSINAPLHGKIASLHHTHEGYIISELTMNILEDSQKTYSLKKTAPTHDFS